MKITNKDIHELIQDQHKDLKEIRKESTRMYADLREIRVDLNNHIKRTDLLEKEFKPLKAHVIISGAIGKGLIALTGIGAAIATIYKIFIL